MMPLHEPRRQRQQQSSVSLIITGVLLTLALLLGTGDAAAVRRVRRSATADDHYAYADDGGSLGGNNAYDRIMINYDEYPMIVPKRAALLLDRLMVALHHALEDGDQEGVRRISDMYRYSRQQQQQQPLLQQLQSLTPSTASLLSNVAATGAYPAAKESTSKFVPNFSFEGVGDVDSTSSASAAGTYMDMQSPDTSGDGRPKQQKQQMNEEMMGMQRRGHAGEALGAGKGHVYWRCYFNAVSCF